MSTDNNNNKVHTNYSNSELFFMVERIHEMNALAINALQNGADVKTCIYPLLTIEELTDTLVSFYDRLDQIDDARTKLRVASGKGGAS